VFRAGEYHNQYVMSVLQHEFDQDT